MFLHLISHFLETHSTTVFPPSFSPPLPISQLRFLLSLFYLSLCQTPSPLNHSSSTLLSQALSIGNVLFRKQNSLHGYPNCNHLLPSALPILLRLLCFCHLTYSAFKTPRNFLFIMFIFCLAPLECKCSETDRVACHITLTLRIGSALW